MGKNEKNTEAAEVAKLRELLGINTAADLETFQRLEQREGETLAKALRRYFKNYLLNK